MPTGMSTDGGPGDEVARGEWRDERRRLALARLRVGPGIAAAAGLLIAPVVAWVFPAPDTSRWPCFAYLTAVSIAVALVSRRPWAERHAIRITIAFHAAVAVFLAWVLHLVPTDVDGTVGTVAMTMVTSALVVPWGPAAQGLASATYALAYVAAKPWTWLDARTANAMLTLAEGVLLSLLSAWVLDRQRRATFAQRQRAMRDHEHAERLAWQREMLLDAGRMLNGTIAPAELCARIASAGRDLVGTDCMLTLLEPDRRTLHIVAVEGQFRMEMLGLRYDMAMLEPSLDEIFAERVIVLPDPTGRRPVPSWFEQLGVRRALLVAIEHHGEHVGLLSFADALTTMAFGEDQVRLASGLAHQAAIALANARLVEALRSANRLKSEFVSTMSHELRTPLNVIMGYTEMLEDGDVESRAIVDRIRASSRELLELIEATLDLSRLEAGRDTPVLEPVPAATLWAELEADFAVVSRRPGVALVWEPPDDLVLRADRRKLRAIVKNLVSNALKFTTEGGVVVSCARVGDAGEVTVRDTGIGIPPNQLEGIFDMFRQVDSSDRRVHGGVGLGLYIVRSFVEQLGGRVEVQSVLGHGSTFRVRLPLAVTGRAPAHASAAVPA